jgi:predicted MPP superfamily phosphohydrolase
LRITRLGAAAAAAGLAWGHFEAGWVRLETLPCPLPGLPPELDGLRIAHLSDFHLGVPSRGESAVERAVEWVEERQPDLTMISGDLLSRPSAEPRLRALFARLPRCFAVLGNHDFAQHTRDPFSHPAALADLEPATLLSDDARTIELRGKRVQIVGVDPRSYRRRLARPERFADP